MPRLRRLKKPKMPPLPECLVPLRRYSPKSVSTVKATKFDGGGYEHLPFSVPFVPRASTCIFSMAGMTFYVPAAFYSIANKAVAFCLQALSNLRKSHSSDWQSAIADAAPIEYGEGVIPCVVQFKSPSADIVVRLTVDTSRLVISLPHPSKWEDAGLRWLTTQRIIAPDSVPPVPKNSVYNGPAQPKWRGSGIGDAPVIPGSADQWIFDGHEMRVV